MPGNGGVSALRALPLPEAAGFLHSLPYDQGGDQDQHTGKKAREIGGFLGELTGQDQKEGCKRHHNSADIDIMVQDFFQKVSSSL